MVPVAPAPEPALGVQPPDLAAVRRRRLWTAVRAVGAGLLAILLVVVAALYWPDVLAALGKLRTPAPFWLAVAIALELASMGFYARMQRRLLRGAGTRVPLRRAVGLAYAAHSMSITLPGGPLVSIAYNYRRMRAFGADSTVAAWCTAASGVLSALGLGALTVLVGAAAAADDADDVVTLAGVGAAGAALVAGLVMLRRRPAWRAALAGRTAALRRRVPEAHRGRFDAALSWAGRLGRVRIPPRDLAAAGGFSVLNWVADGACLAVCCLALGVATRPVPLAVTYIAGMTASSLPLIPGGLGTVDGALTIGLIAAGAKASPALAVVVLYRLITFALIGGIGWLLWLIGRSRTGRG